MIKVRNTTKKAVGKAVYEPSFTLNRLDEESSDVLAVGLERALQVLNVVVADDMALSFVDEFRAYTFEEWSEASSALRIIAHAKRLKVRDSLKKIKVRKKYLIMPKVRPWKLPCALRTIAFPSGTPLRM